MVANLAHGAAEFRATEGADVAVDPHPGKSAKDVVGRAVKVGAPVDTNLELSCFPGFMVVAGTVGFHPRLERGSALIAGLLPLRVSRHSTTVAGPHSGGTRTSCHRQIKASYGGITTHESEMHTENGYSSCQSMIQIDVYSTVDFGNLDNNGEPPVGKACWWYYANSGRDSLALVDIRFNVHDYGWTKTPASCSGLFDLQSVAVHKFGHAYGLGHVSEDGHKYLTMSTLTQRCTSYERTLS